MAIAAAPTMAAFAGGTVDDEARAPRTWRRSASARTRRSPSRPRFRRHAHRDRRPARSSRPGSCRGSTPAPSTRRAPSSARSARGAHGADRALPGRPARPGREVGRGGRSRLMAPAGPRVERTAEPAIRPDLLRRWREAEALVLRLRPGRAGVLPGRPRRRSTALPRASPTSVPRRISRPAYDERGRGVGRGAPRRAGRPDEADWVDVASARDAAFNLRLHDIRGEELDLGDGGTDGGGACGRGDLAADADGSVAFGGQRTFRRVDIHTRAGSRSSPPPRGTGTAA